MIIDKILPLFFSFVLLVGQVVSAPLKTIKLSEFGSSYPKGNSFKSFEGRGQFVISPGGKYAAVKFDSIEMENGAKFERVVCVWNLEEKEKNIRKFDLVTKEPYDRLQRIVFHPTENLVAFAFSSGTVQLWRVSDAKLIKTLIVDVAEDTLEWLVFHPKLHYFAVGTFLTGMVEFWDWELEKCIKKLSGRYSGLSFHESNKYLCILSSRSGKFLTVWDFEHNVCRTTLPMVETLSTAAVFHPTDFEQLFAILPYKNLITSFKWTTKEEIKQFQVNTRFAQPFVIHPSRNFIFTVCFNGVIKKWNTQTGQCTAIFEELSHEGVRIALSSDGKCLISGEPSESHQAIIKIWDAS